MILYIQGTFDMSVVPPERRKKEMKLKTFIIKTLKQLSILLISLALLILAIKI